LRTKRTNTQEGFGWPLSEKGKGNNRYTCFRRNRARDMNNRIRFAEERKKGGSKKGGKGPGDYQEEIKISGAKHPFRVFTGGFPERALTKKT